MKFKVGQKVKCINNKKLNPFQINLPPLKLGGIYMIQKIHSCECGDVKLDIGIYNSNKSIKCSSCSIVVYGTSTWWCASKRFESAEENDLQKELEEAIEEENYELAQEIKNKINNL